MGRQKCSNLLQLNMLACLRFLIDLCSNFQVSYVLVFKPLGFLCTCVQTFRFLMYLCSNLQVSYVLVFKPSGFLFTCVQTFRFLMYLCSNLQVSYVLVFKPSDFLCACVQTFRFLTCLCSKHSIVLISLKSFDICILLCLGPYLKFCVERDRQFFPNCFHRVTEAASTSEKENYKNL